MRKYEDFEKAYQDPFYTGFLKKKDEEYLLDIDSLRVMVRVEVVVVEGGEVVKEHVLKFI